MREVLTRLSGEYGMKMPEHFMLAYDAWAPVDASNGKVPDDKKATWLSAVTAIKVADDYRKSFNRWKTSFSPAIGDRVFELTLNSRLLVGHGNSAASDVGLTVHHTWGVPIIPGSALKGLLAHYVDATYGDDTDEARRKYRSVTWKGSRIAQGPGEVYRSLFGAPDAPDSNAFAGLVTFHDALYVPGSIAGDTPFATDVLTVHQKDYYNSQGKSFPNDYDSPNPVGFITVHPGARFLLALSGPNDWTELAEKLLRNALMQWGVGGKTSAGYGRLGDGQAAGVVAARRGITAANLPKAGDRIEAVLLEKRTKKGGWKVQDEGSGIDGAVQNSAAVPADKKPGDTVTVVVKIARVEPGQSGFEYVGESHP